MALFRRKIKEAGSPAKDGKVNSSAGALRATALELLDSLNYENLYQARQVAAQASIHYPMLQTSAGQAILNVYCETISSLQARVLNRNGNETRWPQWMEQPGSERYPERTFEMVLEQVVSSLLLTGRAFLGLVREKPGDPTSFIEGVDFIEPYSLREQNSRDNKREFLVLNSSLASYKWGLAGGAEPLPSVMTENVERVYSIHDMLIWSGGVTVPGLPLGFSNFDMAQVPVDIALLTQNYTQRHMLYNSQRKDVVIFPDNMSEETQNRMTEIGRKEFVGKDLHAPQFFYLNQRDGSNVREMKIGDTIAESDASMMRLHNSTELASLAGVPLPLAGVAQPGSGSYNSVQALTAFFNANKIEPLVRRIAKGFNRALPKEHRLEFDVSDLVRGDLATASVIVDRLVRTGVINRNEGREILGKPPVEGGDVFMVDKSRIALDDALEPPAAAPVMPAPVEEQDDGSQDETPKDDGRPPGSNKTE